jgi:threonylcarbamoyladenosine tRNA methylthiotransferase MtaB
MNGFQEIVLTGVNLGDYGRKSDSNFLALLEGLHEVSGLRRLKISSIEPNLLTNEIIELAGTSDRLVPHFHIPLQSGSDTILAKMKRRYRSAAYQDRIEKIQQTLPHAAIGVDVISGFPGETEEDFLQTVSFLESLPVAYLHAFTYSEREDTPAPDYEGSIPRAERTRRTRVLRQLSEKKMEAFANRFAGSVRPVLYESVLPDGRISGLTDNYIRVVTDSPKAVTGVIRLTKLGSFQNGQSEGWIPA